MTRPRVVIDTNVLISAAVKPEGLQAQILKLVAFRAVEVFVSQPVMDEYCEVFGRPKFSKLDPKAVARLLDMIQQQATMVRPSRRLAISKHDSDNRFYECAEAAAADYIVTGNLKHFIKPHQNTKIITGRQLLEIVMGNI